MSIISSTLFDSLPQERHFTWLCSAPPKISFTTELPLLVLPQPLLLPLLTFSPSLQPFCYTHDTNPDDRHFLPLFLDFPCHCWIGILGFLLGLLGLLLFGFVKFLFNFFCLGFRCWMHRLFGLLESETGYFIY